MPDHHHHELLTSVRAETRSVLEHRAELRKAIAARTAGIADLEGRAREAERAGDAATADRAREELARAEASRAEALGELRVVEERFRDVLERIDPVDPCDADPAVPLVLLPVRIETRYGPDPSTLRVRVFPDTIHVDQLDRGMTDAEAEAGRAFWRAAAGGGDALDEAWTALVAAVGRKRAHWVAHGLKPTNRSEWLSGAEPRFPDPEPRDRGAAVARLLPDRFVVVVEQGPERVVVRGRPVAHEVVIGLVSADGTELADVGGIRVPEGGEWMVDYDEAVNAGLAVDVELARPGAVDRLFVVGVVQSLERERVEEELASLLTGHRCARGLAFVPQGSPSNNTGTERSEWFRDGELVPPTHLLDPGPAPDGNAAVLARALGIDPAVLDGVEHADRPEQARARAMGAALWPACWGGFLDRLTEPDSDGTNPAVSDATEQAVRDFFNDYVRGRGPLPTIRVGDQPYGFLPVGSTSGSRWEVDDGDRVDTRLLPLLRRIRGWWQMAAARTPRVGSGEDLDETFREILGMHPVSPAVRARTVVTEDATETATEAGLDADAFSATEKLLSRILLRVVGIDDDVLHDLGSVARSSRLVPFPMVHRSDPEYMEGLLAGTPPRAKSLLQAMLGLALESAEEDVDAAAPKGKLPKMVGRVKTLEPRQRARVLALAGSREVDSRTLHLEADRLVASAGEDETGRMALKQLQPVASFRTSFAELAEDSSIDTAREELARWGTIAWVRATARLAEVREGIAALGKTGLQERAILFGEVLDLSSHRLDAWLTGIVDRRRAALREMTPRGLTVGAFGWVENLEPGNGSTPDGGYIHAPSLDHAATAGILRSAFLTHNPDGGGDGAFAIDLSSHRVRTALHLVDGVRQGQQLGALLGYRIERALRDARLGRLILTLRRLAPLVAGRLTDRGESVPPETAQSVAANNVVDGLRLVELYERAPSERAAIRQALDDPPEDNPYLDPDDWPGLTDEEWADVRRIIEDAADASDAAADLLLAESVHQLVLGNTERSSSALSAAGSGDLPPPDPDVIESPAPGMPFEHRILVVAETDADPWNPSRPRALAEPSLEAWAAERLGDPSTHVVGEDAEGEPVTLAHTGLCALDVVYDSGDRRVLEQRVRAALPDLDVETELLEAREDDWPADRLAFGETVELAAAVRSLLVSATPAGPEDFARASDPPARTIPEPALAEVATRGTEIRGLLSTALGELSDAVAPPSGGSPDPGAVAGALEALAAFGAVPPATEGENLLAVAEVAAAEAERRIAEADELLAAPAFEEEARDLGAALFGDGFWMLPRIDPPTGDDLFVTAWGAVEPPRPELRRFVRDVASVRPPVARLAKILLLGDALGRPSELGVAQLATEIYPWVGGVLGEDLPSPDEPVTDVVVLAPATWNPAGATRALVVDRWTDVVPARVRVGGEADDQEAEVGERRASGLAVNAASASARAPQVVLLATSGDGQRWTTDRVVEVLDETLEMARLRTVTLERAPGVGPFLPALYLPAWSLGKEKVFDFRFVAENPHLGSVLSYVKEPP